MMQVVKYRDFSTWFSTINYVLPIIGYTLITSVFLPNIGEIDTFDTYSMISRTVTVPFRVLVLVIAFGTILLNWKTKIRFKGVFGLYALFWALLLFRMFYDMHVRTDIFIRSSEIRMQWIYTIGVCIIPAFSIAKSWKKIDLKLAFILCFIGFLAYLLTQLIKAPDLFFSTGSTGRTYGNIALNTISFGHSGVSVIFIVIATWHYTKSYWLKVFLSFLLIAGFFIAIKAASRGPIVALLAGLLVFYYAKQKHNSQSIVVVVSLTFLFIVFSGFLWNVISEISPTMANRMEFSGDVDQYEEFMNGRSDRYEYALEKFLENPIFGYGYGIFHSNGSVEYSHNIVLDAFMATGILGGGIFVFILFCSFKNVFYTIRNHKNLSWLALLVIQAIIMYQFSGNFYESDFLQFALITALLIFPLKLNPKV